LVGGFGLTMSVSRRRGRIARTTVRPLVGGQRPSANVNQMAQSYASVRAAATVPTPHRRAKVQYHRRRMLTRWGAKSRAATSPRRVSKHIRVQSPTTTSLAYNIFYGTPKSPNCISSQKVSKTRIQLCNHTWQPIPSLDRIGVLNVKY
jgi:hypothetical protein